MAESPKTTEDRISEAYQIAKNQEKPNLKGLARQFGVPYDRFRRRFHGQPPKSAKKPTNKNLNNAQEEALIRWIR